MADVAKKKGNEAFQNGNFDEAVGNYTDAIALDPDNHVHYSNRSGAYAALKKYQEALSDAQKTVELKPNWIKGYFRLGAAHDGLRNYADAVSAYEKGLDLDPSNIVLENSRKDAKANEVFKSSGTAKPTGTQEQSGNIDNDDLRNYVRKCTEDIAVASDNHVLYFNRSRAYASLKMYQQALSDAQKFVELKPDSAMGYSRLGAALFSLRNYADAVSAYKKGLDLDPTNQIMQYGLKNAQSALKEEEEEKVLRLSTGFVRVPIDPSLLRRHLFPSKAGGLPAWLDPIDLPSGQSCLCDICGKPLQFLFQVFRCQLPRENRFYSSEEPKRDGTDKPSGSGAPLCSWCGTWKGDKVCCLCRRARYCSDKHQDVHWTAGHKIECLHWCLRPQSSNSCSTGSSEQAASNRTWPEISIISKNQPMLDTDALLKRNEGESFYSFKKCMVEAPGLVVRWCEARANLLWPMSSGQPSEIDIPKCTNCGGRCDFQFQVLPQSLSHYFDVKNAVRLLDCATISVYSCGKTCKGSGAYTEEFVWVHLPSQSSTVP